MISTTQTPRGVPGRGGKNGAAVLPTGVTPSVLLPQPHVGGLGFFWPPTPDVADLAEQWPNSWARTFLVGWTNRKWVIVRGDLSIPLAVKRRQTSPVSAGGVLLFGAFGSAATGWKVRTWQT